MAQYLGTEPIVLDLAAGALHYHTTQHNTTYHITSSHTVESQPSSGFPIAGQTMVDIKNNHFEYAVTWCVANHHSCQM